MSAAPYCASRLRPRRRASVEVSVGTVRLGGTQPVRVQSMVTSDTQDIEATVRQSIALAETGCEMVRITAPNTAAARCLREIRRRLDQAGWAALPLVADIHFLPSAAMEAVEHVEKVRVNPGNYADKKRFLQRDYTDAEYAEELERLRESFAPLVRRCRALGRTLRIGTNHGSLSDRIMNRHGDTPLGMVESALEFVRICESEGFHDIVLSMKASNPKVMIQAYRLLVSRMDAAHRPYPLHLGVTEAGDGEDGRIKSAIGIGSLLADGLGDTIRVSLTEDSIHEIPVAQALARMAHEAWEQARLLPEDHAAEEGSPDPFSYRRRAADTVELAPGLTAGSGDPPRVLLAAPPGDGTAVAGALAALRQRYRDLPIEGLLLPDCAGALAQLPEFAPRLSGQVRSILVEAPRAAEAADLLRRLPVLPVGSPALGAVAAFGAGDGAALQDFLDAAQSRHLRPWVCTTAGALRSGLGSILRHAGGAWVAALDAAAAQAEHPEGTALSQHRRLLGALHAEGLRPPLWIRCRRQAPDFSGRLLEASVLAGALLADGAGDCLSVESEPDAGRALALAYNILQGSGTRVSKTEFVACPSCGRTLFDLQSTTQRIRAATGHLKGVKIAIMGCIVNGPGEMADADFGYVGGAPGKVNLYVGKSPVRYNIPEAQAVEHLVGLIREHGRWVDPVPTMPAL